MAYQAWSVVYGEQPSASKWNILGSNDAHFYSYLGDVEPWITYSPTIANFTQGTSTVVAKYIQIGSYVRVSVIITLAVGFSISGNISVTNPVPSISLYASTSRGGMGWVRLIDANGSTYYGQGRMASTTTFQPMSYTTNAVTYAGTALLTGTVPFTWASTDVMMFEWEYEAAS